MRAFWDAVELFDRSVFDTLERVDRLLSKKPLRERVADEVKDVREPQRVITFQK